MLLAIRRCSGQPSDALCSRCGHDIRNSAQAYNMQISLIEDLFQVQTNAVCFANHNLYIKTPILAAVAAFCWLVPIATIYPPGALVVGLQTSMVDTSFNVSGFHQKNLLNAEELGTIATISCPFDVNDNFLDAAKNTSQLKVCRLSSRSVYFTIFNV